MAVWLRDKRGRGGVSQNDFNNLSNRVLVKDSADQVAQSLQVSKKPVNAYDVMRREDFDWYGIVNHNSQIANNVIREWTISNSIKNNNLYEFFVKIATQVSNIDVNFAFKIYVNPNRTSFTQIQGLAITPDESVINMNNMFKF